MAQALVILGILLWIYWPALRGGFIWDDSWYITKNSLLRDGDGLWKFWFVPGSWTEYYPIQESVLWLEWQLWGDHPLAYHLVNLALHGAGALLLWRLLKRLGLRQAWLGGLLFAVLPVHVESVAWMSELKNALSLPFCILAMTSWIEYDERRQNRDYALALIFFVTAMGCKIAVAPFPLLILLFAWWKRGRLHGDDLRAAAPFFLVALALSLLSIQAGMTYEQRSHAQDLTVSLGGPVTQTLRAATILSFYFVSCLVPIDLAPIHFKWSTQPGSFIAWLPLLAWLGFFIWLWTRRRGWGRHALLGLGFFVICLAPFLGFLFISYMTDTWTELRLLYLPSLGLIGLFVAIVGDVEMRLPPAARPMAGGLLALALAGLAVAAHDYARWYTSEETFWTRTTERLPNAWLPHYNLGCELLAQKRYPEALAQFQQAAALQPDYAEGRVNLGLALQKMDRPQEAEAEFHEALRALPGCANACLSLGEMKRASGDPAAAEALFRQGLEAAPDSAPLNIDLAGMLLQSGQVGEAIQLYQRAVGSEPDLAQLQYDLGVALMRAGDMAGAGEHFKRAVELDPGVPAAHENLGAVLAQARRLPEAILQFQAALALDPQLQDSRNNLALALAQTGQIEASIEQFKQELEYHPDDTQARERLDKLEQYESRQAVPASP